MDWQLAIAVVLIAAASAYVIQRMVAGLKRRSCCDSGCEVKASKETLIQLSVRQSVLDA